MSISGFKKLFSEITALFGWATIPGGWSHPANEADDCRISIELQKSSYGKQFYLGIKIHFNRAFRNTFDARANTSAEPTHLYRRQPKELDAALDLTNSLNDSQRTEQLHQLFRFLNEFGKKAKTISGIRDLQREGLIWIPPDIEKEIAKLAPRNWNEKDT